MRWPPQSPWATSGCERCTFIQRQRSPRAREAAAAGGPCQSCGRARVGGTWGWRGLLVADRVPPLPHLDFRAGLPPPPRFASPPSSPFPSPSHSFQVLSASPALSPLLPSLFSSPPSARLPSLPPAPQPSGKVKRKSFRRIFVKSALIRGITSRIKGGRDPLPFCEDNLSGVLKGPRETGHFLDRILSLPLGAWPLAGPRPLSTRRAS